jgi:ribonuclease Z
MKLNISGYSTALFSTWYFIEEFGLLFDAGDGLTAALLQKTRKIESVFISHAHRDHVTGLLQLNQLNARNGFPKIYYPSDCGSFAALEAFSKQFDPHVQGTTWYGIQENEAICIKENLFVQSIRNNHVQAALHLNKSFGFQVYQNKLKLKSEFADLPQSAIKELIQKVGKSNMTEVIRTNLLTYSGDTPVDDFEKWNHTQILIHEATFLEQEEQDQLNIQKKSHSNLESVLKMVSELTIDTLILGHFSSRYSKEQIDDKIKYFCKKYDIKIPVHRVLPGQTHFNILNETPIN